MINYVVISLLIAVIILIIYLLLKDKFRKEEGNIVNARIDNLQNLMLNQLNAITKQVNDLLKENRDTISTSSQAVYRQFVDFSSKVFPITENIKQIQETMKNVVSFQEIFRSPKLRGGWGETSLDNLLREYFGEDAYYKQYHFKSGEVVDFAVKLPNDLLLPIDSKFPKENFMKMVETEDEKSKLIYKKMFIDDVKKHIDDISQKYIIPAENTIEAALMFIPAEAIYYEIINSIKEVDLSDYAFKRRVIATSPNTLRLHIASIMHWFKDVQVSKQTKNILKGLSQIMQDAKKLKDSFEKLGKHLNDAKSSFEDSEKRLNLLTERSTKLITNGIKEDVDTNANKLTK